MSEAEKLKKNELKPVQPRKGKYFKVKYLPKNKYPPLQPIKRPPWDNDLVLRPSGNQFTKKVQCKVIDVEIPCPDYRCFKAFQYKCEGDKTVPVREVLLMQKNYKPALWCDTKKHYKQIKHCTEIVCGKTKEFETELPSNYREVYIDEKSMRNCESQGKGRKAYIYVPLNRQQETDSNVEGKRIFFENTRAKASDETNNLQRQAYKRTDRFAFIPN
ncbi:hypothetical protein RRG08_050236 [Elysia crispata]|uniref:Uncharacterized protein n=1 Tax=Elysia crispata TaxID=231223 RepID=A0AAE1E9G5_9GAST|nr:hypothetical protein RRG08_050236 [Elysia crispata]